MNTQLYVEGPTLQPKIPEAMRPDLVVVLRKIEGSDSDFRITEGFAKRGVPDRRAFHDPNRPGERWSSATYHLSDEFPVPDGVYQQLLVHLPVGGLPSFFLLARVAKALPLRFGGIVDIEQEGPGDLVFGLVLADRVSLAVFLDNSFGAEKSRPLMRFWYSQQNCEGLFATNETC